MITKLPAIPRRRLLMGDTLRRLYAMPACRLDCYAGEPARRAMPPMTFSTGILLPPAAGIYGEMRAMHRHRHLMPIFLILPWRHKGKLR